MFGKTALSCRLCQRIFNYYSEIATKLPLCKFHVTLFRWVDDYVTWNSSRSPVTLYPTAINTGTNAISFKTKTNLIKAMVKELYSCNVQSGS